jgi:hypothetical protein
MSTPSAGGLPDPQQPWREQVLARSDALGQLATSMGVATAVQDFLRTARAAAGGTSSLPEARRARMERAFAHLDGAEAALLGAAPEAYVLGQLPALVAHTIAHLPPAHPERLRVEQLSKTPPDPLSAIDRASLVGALAAASAAARREHTRLRSFRNIVIMTFFALLVLAIGVAVVGAKQPAWIPLCFAPQTLEKVVCPTGETALTPADSEAETAATGPTAGPEPTPGPEPTASPDATPGPEPTASPDATPSPEPTPSGDAGDDATGTVASQGTGLDEVVARTAQSQDVALVMLLGLVAAAVTGAAALRRMRGTSTPFSVPVALIALKLPLGALTAVVGLLLLGGGFVPGFSALDSSGQILAWALVFGAAQQLVTGLVDKKAQTVLNSVGSAPMTSETE